MLSSFLRHRIVLKLFVAVFVCTCMVGGTIVTQKIQSDLHYVKPYLLTYSACMSLVLLAVYQYVIFRFQGKTSGCGCIGLKYAVEDTVGRPFWQFWLLSIPFAILYFAANYLFTTGLAFTNLASTLSLEQASVVFIFILSVFFLKEKVTYIKCFSLLMVIGGGIVVGFADGTDENGKNALVGDILIVSSTVATALYMVFYSRQLHALPNTGVALFLSCIGFDIFIIFFPGLIIIHVINFEIFEWPTHLQILFFLLHMAIGVIYNLFLNLGIIWTTPLFMRLVTACSVPASFFVDIVIFNVPLNLVRLAGSVFIVVGFILFSVLGDNELGNMCARNFGESEYEISSKRAQKE